METLKEAVKRFLAISSVAGDGSGYGDGYGYGSGNGDGYGYGDGYGNGYGNGYGDGNGSGYGDGYGSGYGDGDGDGNGNGDGYGNGYGDGYGYGYGSGNGYGDGSGIKTFGGYSVYIIDGTQTILYQVHGDNIAKGAILNSDLTLTPCFVVKGSDKFAHGHTLRQALQDLQTKIFKDLPVEKRIDAFVAEFLTPDKPRPASEFFKWHHILTGSCEMGRLSFARDHDIDLDSGVMTVREFIDLTKDAYGGNVIMRLVTRYE